MSADTFEHPADFAIRWAAERGLDPYRKRRDPCILEQVAFHNSEASIEAELADVEWDPYLRAAAELCVRRGEGATEALRTLLNIPHKRAEKLIRQLELAGVLGPANRHHPREVLATQAEIERHLFPEPTDP